MKVVSNRVINDKVCVSTKEDGQEKKLEICQHLLVGP